MPLRQAARGTDPLPHGLGQLIIYCLIDLARSHLNVRQLVSILDRSQTWEQWSAELASKKSIPLGRLGSPAEAARAIFYLATPLSSYTTGSHIDVSGGLSRHA